MIKTIAATLFALTLAIGGGALLTWRSLQGENQFGAVRLGNWTAFPQAGTPDADPYSKARLARDATLTLGAAEGVTLYASQDSEGQRLRSACRYTVQGKSPTARLWTLQSISRTTGDKPQAGKAWPLSLSSRSIVYNTDMSFAITVSASAEPGNWLAQPWPGAFDLALTLYDSPVATNKGLVDTDLPAVNRIGCDG